MPTRRQLLHLSTAALAASLFPRRSSAADTLPVHARDALHRAVESFRAIATHGGYLWTYSADLKDRRGEGKASPTQIWVQPPGTPAVGQAMLRAWRATGDESALAAAREAADALAYGQLESGGWHYSIDFNESADRSLRRSIAANLPPAQKQRLRNITTFDDNTTQSAIRFLLAMTQTKDPADKPDRAARLQSALDYALAALLRAQYPNGAFPQAYMGAPRKPEDHPAIKANLPADWHDLPKIKEYWFHYTLNDDTTHDCVTTLLEGHRRLNKPEYLDAVKRCGDFLLLAQLPAPHPAWAQQYDFQMRPAWARKFEPPAVCTHESAGVCRTLVDIHLATGDDKYLAPIPAALAWFDKVKLPDGRWSRFYELNTNKPLYLNRAYEVVYTDNDLPTHYGFQGEYGLASAANYYTQVKQTGRAAWLEKHQEKPRKPNPKTAQSLAPKVKDLIASLDSKDRWLNKDTQIDCRLFIQNTNTLCDYLEAQ